MAEPRATDFDRIASRRGSVLFVEETATVAEAASAMTKNHVGSLIVRNGSEKPTGILTERDILRKVVAEGQDPSGVSVAAIMSTKLICCNPWDSFGSLQQMMARFKIRHLPIVQNGVAIGIVTSRDFHAHELSEARRTEQDPRRSPTEGTETI